MVHVFEEMTNAFGLFEKKTPLATEKVSWSKNGQERITGHLWIWSHDMLYLIRMRQLLSTLYYKDL